MLPYCRRDLASGERLLSAGMEKLCLRLFPFLCCHTAFTLTSACLPADGGDPEMEPELTKESPDKSQKEEEEEEEDELDPLMLAKKAKQLARRGMSFNAKETGAKVGTRGLAGYLLSSFNSTQLK